MKLLLTILFLTPLPIWKGAGAEATAQRWQPNTSIITQLQQVQHIAGSRYRLHLTDANGKPHYFYFKYPGIRRPHYRIGSSYLLQYDSTQCCPPDSNTYIRARIKFIKAKTRRHR